MRVYFQLNTSCQTNSNNFTVTTRQESKFLFEDWHEMKPVSTTTTPRDENTQYNGSDGKLKPVICVTHFTAWTPNVNVHTRTGQTVGLQCTYVGLFTFNYNQIRSDIITTLSPSFSTLCPSIPRNYLVAGRIFLFLVDSRPCSVLYL